MLIETFKKLQSRKILCSCSLLCYTEEKRKKKKEKKGGKKLLGNLDFHLKITKTT